jgi:hypothetical protein
MLLLVRGLLLSFPIYEVWQEHGGTFLGISNGDPEAMQEIARDLNVSFYRFIE